MIHSLIKAFYLSGEETKHGKHEEEDMWKYPAYVESKRKMFENIDKNEKIRLERDKNANWPLRAKLRIMNRRGELNGLEEEFIWLRYKIILMFRKFKRITIKAHVQSIEYKEDI